MAVIIGRTLLSYLVLLICLRLLGKRQLGEMELWEFVLAALAADLAAHPLQDLGIPMLNGLLPILVLFCTELLISGLAMKSLGFRRLLSGRPSLLIKRGRIIQSEMRKNRFTLDELLQQLRMKGCMDIASVEYAVLEPDGSLSLILFPSKRPVSAADLGIYSGKGGWPLPVISDGRVIDENLARLRLSRDWLNKKLSKLGYSDPKQVFLLTVNQYMQCYSAGKEEP